MLSKHEKAMLDMMNVLNDYLREGARSESCVYGIIKKNSDSYQTLIQELSEMLQKPRIRYPWEKDEVSYLIDLFEMNKSWAEIASTLRRSVGAVIGRLIKEKCLPDDFLDHEKLNILKKSDLVRLNGGRNVRL